MEYALVVGTVVSNIIALHPMNAREFPNAVPINGLPVRVGDTYEDGRFFHNGVELKQNPFEDEPYGLPIELTMRIKDDAITEIEEAVLNGTDE